jgi:hypothetical protein
LGAIVSGGNRDMQRDWIVAGDGRRARAQWQEDQGNKPRAR